jgi:hypothetical protein
MDPYVREEEDKEKKTKRTAKAKAIARSSLEKWRRRIETTIEATGSAR